MFKSSLAAEVHEVLEVRIKQVEEKLTIILEKIEEMKTSNAVLAALKDALK